MLDEDGLHLYTRDDVKFRMDELERLRCDAPLSLCVSADRPVRLHLRSVALPKQGLLICATDGVYGCVFSPMELEEIFLASLTGAQDAATWQRRLAAVSYTHLPGPSFWRKARTGAVSAWAATWVT